MENYYELLGIVSSATKDEIERALRRAAERQTKAVSGIFAESGEKG